MWLVAIKLDSRVLIFCGVSLYSLTFFSRICRAILTCLCFLIFFLRKLDFLIARKATLNF